jgi:hypothetical protein
MKAHLALSVPQETKIVLDAVATLLQKSPSGVVELAVSSFLAALPEEQRRAVETLKAAAVANMEAAPTTSDGAAPPTTYRFSRLCFRRDMIEPIGQSEAFRIITPIGTFQLTKSDFYRDFQNVVESKSYREDGIYHYPKLPARAERYRVS